MRNNTFTNCFLLGLLFLATACKKDCQVVQADWSPTFLYHDGMAPEGVVLEPDVTTADSYLWSVEGNTSTTYRDTFNFETSGDFSVTLTTTEGKNDCQQTDIITIRDYPFLNTDRALSFFESNGSNVRLITKVIDYPEAGNYTAISYSVGLPENGGGMDYDNGEKKLFAAPLALLASCYPNNADLQFPIPPDSTSNRVIFDTALDPDDGLAYISGTEDGSMFIRSTMAYGTGGTSTAVYTDAINSDFVYLTTDRVNNVIYWTDKKGDTIYKIENGLNEVFLTGGPFYDLDFDNNKGILFYVEDQVSSYSIKNINIATGQIKTDAVSINGEVSFIYVDEETQELFWVNNLFKEIWSKRIQFEMSSAELHIANVGKIRGMAVGNFVVE